MMLARLLGDLALCKEDTRPKWTAPNAGKLFLLASANKSVCYNALGFAGVSSSRASGEE
jgi:hypothetical protein